MIASFMKTESAKSGGIVAGKTDLTSMSIGLSMGLGT